MLGATTLSDSVPFWDYGDLSCVPPSCERFPLIPRGDSMNQNVDISREELAISLLARIEKLHNMLLDMGVTYAFTEEGLRWDMAEVDNIEATKPVVNIEGAITKKDGTVVPFSITTKVEENK